MGTDRPAHKRAALLLCSGEKLQFLLHSRPLFEPNLKLTATASRYRIRLFSELLPPIHSRPSVVRPQGARNRQLGVLSTLEVVHHISESWMTAAVNPVRWGNPCEPAMPRSRTTGAGEGLDVQTVLYDTRLRALPARDPGAGDRMRRCWTTSDRVLHQAARRARTQ